jgi:DNA-binding SARP family transcriptional activator
LEAEKMSDPVRGNRRSGLALAPNTTAGDQTGRQVVEVLVLGRVSVRIAGREVGLPRSIQRPVAYLAVSRQAVTRLELASALWPDSSSSAGLARLRNDLWKIRRLVPDLVRSGSKVALADHVTVDLHEARRIADELLLPESGPPEGWQLDLLHDDLLVDWDEEWLALDQRAHSFLRSHALEKLARHRLEASLFYEAEWACRSVIATDPYRESTRLLLADVHIAEGNGGLALRELVEFQRLLIRDLGVLPNDRIRRLITAIRAGP